MTTKMSGRCWAGPGRSKWLGRKTRLVLSHSVEVVVCERSPKRLQNYAVHLRWPRRSSADQISSVRRASRAVVAQQQRGSTASFVGDIAAQSTSPISYSVVAEQQQRKESATPKGLFTTQRLVVGSRSVAGGDEVGDEVEIGRCLLGKTALAGGRQSMGS